MADIAEIGIDNLPCLLWSRIVRVHVVGEYDQETGEKSAKGTHLGRPMNLRCASGKGLAAGLIAGFGRDTLSHGSFR